MAFSGDQLTRLGLSGVPRQLYGSFAGKAATVIAEGIEFSLGDQMQMQFSLRQLPEFSEGDKSPEFSL